MLIRHGDVVLVPVAEVPAGKTVRRKHGKLVLAEGEITGHAHVIEAPDVKLVTSEEAECIVWQGRTNAHYSRGIRPYVQDARRGLAFYRSRIAALTTAMRAQPPRFSRSQRRGGCP